MNIKYTAIKILNYINRLSLTRKIVYGFIASILFSTFLILIIVITIFVIILNNKYKKSKKLNKEIKYKQLYDILDDEWKYNTDLIKGMDDRTFNDNAFLLKTSYEMNNSNNSNNEALNDTDNKDNFIKKINKNRSKTKI
jgi:hypothetical protein